MLAVTLTVQQFCPWDQLVQLLIPQMKKLRPRVWKALVSKVKALATSPFDGLPVSWLTLRLDWPIGQKTSGNRLPLGSAIPSWLQNRATVWDWHCADGGWASLLLPPSEPISWAGWPHRQVQRLLSSDRAGFHCSGFLQPALFITSCSIFLKDTEHQHFLENLL